jgi:hypothetical protein
MGEPRQTCTKGASLAKAPRPPPKPGAFSTENVAPLDFEPGLAHAFCRQAVNLEGAHRLRRVLLSLADVTLRVGWLRAHLGELREADAAELLSSLCEDGERADPDSREALLIVAMVLAADGDSPFVERLRQQAEERRLLSLARLLRRGPEGPGRSLSEPPVPDYGTGRELTVGERRSLARSNNRRVLEKLLRDPHPLVLRQLLGNPRLTEDDVVRLVARRPLPRTIAPALAESPRWLRRPRIRLTLLLNPGTPPPISMPLLAVCTRCELLEVVHGADAPLALRGSAQELLERSPPLQKSATDSTVLQ